MPSWSITFTHPEFPDRDQFLLKIFSRSFSMKVPTLLIKHPLDPVYCQRFFILINQHCQCYRLINRVISGQGSVIADYRSILLPKLTSHHLSLSKITHHAVVMSVCFDGKFLRMLMEETLPLFLIGTRMNLSPLFWNPATIIPLVPRAFSKQPHLNPFHSFL